MSRLIHAGSAVVDYVYRIDALPSPGTEKVAARYDRVAGGGFNMMVAASRQVCGSSMPASMAPARTAISCAPPSRPRGSRR